MHLRFCIKNLFNALLAPPNCKIPHVRDPRALHRFLSGQTLPGHFQARNPEVISEGPGQTSLDPYTCTHFPNLQNPLWPGKDREGRVGRK